MQKFVQKLRDSGELDTIKVEVDSGLEIAEIADRSIKNGGKALLFKNVAGSRFPLLINMFGSNKRLCLALGCDTLEQAAPKIESLFHSLMTPGHSLLSKLKLLPILGGLSRLLPRRCSSKGECQQVIHLGEDAKLDMLPILQCWPNDGGRFITLPLVHTLDPESGKPNVGMYRMQVFDNHTAGLHWHKHKSGDRHYEGYKRLGKRMAISVCLGGDPCYSYAATAPMPEGMDEYLLAGYLRGRGVKMVKSITNDIWVASDCDFVIEGYVDPTQEKVMEGPFGDHTGFYSLEDLYPYMHITAITHKRDAIYPATIVGIPPQEDLFLGEATEKIFLAPIRLALQSEVRDLWMPSFGVAHNLALVQIDKRYEAQGVKVVNSLWGAGQMMFNKVMIVSSESVRDVELLGRTVRNSHLGEDLLRSRGPLDVLDHASGCSGVGGKLALDLTVGRSERKIYCPDCLEYGSEIASIETRFAASWGAIFLFAKPGSAIDLEGVISKNNIEGVNYYIALDHKAASLAPSDWLWLALGNCEVGRDVDVITRTRQVDGVAFDEVVLFADCRSKIGLGSKYPKRWPNVVCSDAATISLVDSRWGDYNLSSFVGPDYVAGATLPQPLSPSLRYRELLCGDSAEFEQTKECK